MKAVNYSRIQLGSRVRTVLRILEIFNSISLLQLGIRDETWNLAILLSLDKGPAYATIMSLNKTVTPSPSRYSRPPSRANTEVQPSNDKHDLTRPNNVQARSNFIAETLMSRLDGECTGQRSVAGQKLRDM